MSIKSKTIDIVNSPLYRNSLWLMGGSFSMAAIGFVYWLIASKFYSPTEVGLAATFFSAVSLVNGFATLGFNVTLLRYLPKSESISKLVNTSFSVLSISALFFGIIYLLGISFWTPSLDFIRASLPVFILVLAFFPLNTLNAITDSVFTGLREAQWVFLSNSFQSLVKLIALILLPTFGVWGLIGSNVIGAIFALLLCLILINRRYKIILKPDFNTDTLRKVRRYAFGNYISGLIGTLPGLLLPIIITNRVSAEQTAYFYMPNMLATLMGIIPSTISKSYLTESSHADSPVSIQKPLFLTYCIMVPPVLILIFFGKTILSLFGHNYSVNGYNYLVLISVSILISIVNYFLGSKLLVQHRLRIFTIVTAISSLSYIIGSYFLSSLGIEGIGIASILSQIISFFLLASATMLNKKI